MALDLEEQIMSDIGLSRHYDYFNGSGSCQYIRDEAVARLPAILEKHGLKLHQSWAEALKLAIAADQINSGDYGLTNVWVTASNAIRDAMEGGGSFAPDFKFSFHSGTERARWEQFEAARNRADAFQDVPR